MTCISNDRVKAVEILENYYYTNFITKIKNVQSCWMRANLENFVHYTAYIRIRLIIINIIII